jgi:hypothetical protein
VRHVACRSRSRGSDAYSDLVSVELSAQSDLPQAFRSALDGLSGVDLRPELVVRELPAPQRLAPYAVALHAAAVVGDDELAEGRLVVLHDPDGQDVWSGDTRCVAYVQADVVRVTVPPAAV